MVTSRERLREVVKKVIKDDGFPIYEMMEDSGLEIEEYVDFVESVLLELGLLKYEPMD